MHRRSRCAPISPSPTNLRRKPGCTDGRAETRETAPPAFLPQPTPLAHGAGAGSRNAQVASQGERRRSSLWLQSAALIFGGHARADGRWRDGRCTTSSTSAGVTMLEWALSGVFRRVIRVGRVLVHVGAGGVPRDRRSRALAPGLDGGHRKARRPRWRLPHRHAAADLQRRPACRHAPGFRRCGNRWRPLGEGAHFDWFLLSDTTDPDIWIDEEAAFRRLTGACAEVGSTIAVAPTTMRANPGISPTGSRPSAGLTIT